MGYTKLFSEIITSTIWAEPDETRIVWITMLALKDKWGVVGATMPGLAHMARVDVEVCRKAIEKFLGPDPDSRTPDHEGRRIEVVDGGWRILNHEKYRRLMSADERREYLAEKQREYRSRQQVVNKSKQESTVSTHTDADTKADAYSDIGAIRPKPRAARAAPAVADSDFLEELSKSPAYEGIDVRREFEKMKAWACTNKKLPSRRRLVNWLNRAERPMNGSGYQPHAPLARNGTKEPPGWKAWLNHRRSDSPLATGGEREAHDWFSIDRASQEIILNGMKDEPI
jgi:hypothetical protein